MDPSDFKIKVLCVVHCQTNNLLRFEIISLYDNIIRQESDT
jgi:hypothetical protein